MRQRMQKSVLPLLGSRDIESIRVSEIYRLLQEIREKNETARQLINYMGQCYTFAAALEYTSRLNPAPALRQLMRLPGIKDHYPALGYQQQASSASCFRTWMAEHGVDFAVAEASLAHVEHNAVVRAYSRTDYLE